MTRRLERQLWIAQFVFILHRRRPDFSPDGVGDIAASAWLASSERAPADAVSGFLETLARAGERVIAAVMAIGGDPPGAPGDGDDRAGGP